jgi:hypothetical protein
MEAYAVYLEESEGVSHSYSVSMQNHRSWRSKNVKSTSRCITIRSLMRWKFSKDFFSIAKTMENKWKGEKETFPVPHAGNGSKDSKW